MKDHDQPAPKTQAAELPKKTSRTVSFRELGQGAREVIIEHEGQIYRLLETRNGKLILNK